jgi:hypothetical protein
MDIPINQEGMTAPSNMLPHVWGKPTMKRTMATATRPNQAKRGHNGQKAGPPKNRSQDGGGVLKTRNAGTDNGCQEMDQLEIINKSEEWAVNGIHSESNLVGTHGGARDTTKYQVRPVSWMIGGGTKANVFQDDLMSQLRAEETVTYNPEWQLC